MVQASRSSWGFFGAFLFLASVLEAAALPSAHDYYGSRFHQLHVVDQSSELRLHLNQVLSDFHVSQAGKLDQIVDECPDLLEPGQICFKRRSLSYEEARYYLFGDERFHLRADSAGRFMVTDVYCRKEFKNKIGPGKIPNPADINTEHTWPQSHFFVSPKGFMKTDLNHLFPTDSRANSIRGNHPFGEVEDSGDQDQIQERDFDCQASRLGRLQSLPGMDPEWSRSSELYFEPPDEHKGNVARAMFYFAVRYKMDIDPAQEFFLRRWHESDPVDEAEKTRNEAVYTLQYLRNPFIDYPDLVARISDF